MKTLLVVLATCCIAMGGNAQTQTSEVQSISRAFQDLISRRGSAQAKPRELPLQSGDKLALVVNGIPSEDAQAVNHNYTVAEDGTIALEYIDRVQAAGLKSSDLARKIENLFKSKEIYAHPSVTVSLDTTSDARLVFVSGEVVRRRAIPFRPGLTVSKVIASACGLTSFPSIKKVKLKRNGRVIRELNLSKASSTDGDVLVKPDDEIVVPN